jgi:cell division protein FtsI (penicillin-binding protein 3)
LSLPISKRYSFVVLFFLILFVILFIRIFYLTVIGHTDQKEIIQSNFSSLLRGNIYSNSKDLLAVSLPFYSIYINPELIDKERYKNYVAFLKLFKLSDDNITDLLNSHKKFRWIYRMLTKASFDKVQKIRFFFLPGINYTVEYKRAYPYQNMASSVLGFTNIDGKGLAGLEYSLDSFLLPSKNNNNISYDIILTLNTRLQKRIEKIMQKTAQQLEPKSISSIIMEADTGKILTMASYPSFNINYFNQYRDPSLFINTNVSNIDEPGSTFKPLVITYLFDHNIITENQRFYADGKTTINGSSIRDVNNKVLGLLTPKEILMKSSNIGMAKASALLRKESLYLFLRNMGFGSKTAITLPAEENGIIRTPENMSGRSKLVIPIGQEIGVTPIQLVRAFSAIANHGVMVTPRIVDYLEHEGKIFWPENFSSFFSFPSIRVYTSQNADLVLSYMRSVVTDGTASRINIPGEWIAGKTGTAQVFNLKKRQYDKVNASILAIYKPRHSNKKYIIYGVIRDPNTSLDHSWGGTLGATMVKQFIQAFIKELAPHPS